MFKSLFTKIILVISLAIITGFILLGVFYPQWGETMIIGALVFVGVSLVVMQLGYAYYLFNMDKTRRQHEMTPCPYCEALIYHTDDICPYCKKQAK